MKKAKYPLSVVLSGLAVLLMAFSVTHQGHTITPKRDTLIKSNMNVVIGDRPVINPRDGFSLNGSLMTGGYVYFTTTSKTYYVHYNNVTHIDTLHINWRNVKVINDTTVVIK